MKNIYHIIGIMSGTSLDGVDFVYVEIDRKCNYTYKIIHSKTYSYTKGWRKLLKNAFSQSDDSLQSLDTSYGKYLGHLVLKFVREFTIENVDFIAFLDIANVWGVDYNSSLDINDEIRSSVGLGIDWFSPIGPMNFTFAESITKADTDITESFRFNLGTTF